MIVFIGEAISSERYPMVVGGEYFVPYLLNKPGSGHYIKGEVYCLDDDLQKDTDIFESNYTRLSIPLQEPHNNISCYAYFKTIVSDDFWNLTHIDDYPYDERYVPPHKRIK